MTAPIRAGLAAAALSLIGVVALLGAGTAAAEGEAPCPNEALRVEQHMTQLPDCRAYELVSAADKSGADVVSDPQRVRVAEDGSAAGYASLGGFGDTVGGGIATEYMAMRDPSVGGQEWVTHAISPPQPALPFSGVVFGYEPRYEQDLSPDLSSGVVFAWKPLTSDPRVRNAANLYLRTDLRTPGAGSYTLITACPACIGPLPPSSLSSPPQFTAGTPDLRHLLFESPLNLTAGAFGGGTKLYEWDAEKASGPSQGVSLIGVFPDGTPAPDAAAGIGHGRFQHRNAISSDGSKVFFEATQNGVQNVYMRLDETTTIKLNESETSNPEAPQPAQYWAAASDGSRVFFTTDQALTDDASHDNLNKLYMYDTTEPASDPHNLTLINTATNPRAESNGVQGVVGASADGRTVYFYDSAELVAGQTPFNSGVNAGMYAWQDGQLSFVAPLYGDDEQGLPDNITIGYKSARVSASGQLIYLSSQPVGPDGYAHGSCSRSPSGACAELYVYDPDAAAGGQLSCASCNPSGAPASTDAQTVIVAGAGGSAITGHLGRVISDDGRRVFFMTREALVPQDVNGEIDVYEYDTVTGAVSLISTGQDPENSYLMELTPNGNDVFFTTREQLTGWDADTNFDLYDARVDGGVPDPPPAPAGCAGEGCRGAPSTPPGDLGPASSTLAGAGNPHSPRPCAKRRPKAGRRHGARCLKRHRNRRHVKPIQRTGQR